MLLLFALTAPCGAARRHARLPTFEWGLDVSAAAVYNDNILRLSGRDTRSFLSDPATLTEPLKSVDDLETEIALSPRVQWRAPQKLMLSADYRMKAVSRVRNGFTDYQTHQFAVSARPRVIGYRWSARARVSAIPSFYLRAYRDRDYGERHAARFANYEYEGSVRYRVRRDFWAEAAAAWGSYYYNSKFTEYDSEYWTMAAGVRYALPHEIRLNGSYARVLSVNIGKDQTGATTIPPSDEPLPIEDTEYGDAGFHEDEIRTAISAVLPWIKFVKTEADVGYRWRRRVYVTNRSLESDPFHRGRLDYRHVVTAGLTSSLRADTKLSSYFSYETRTAHSPLSSVPAAKDFIRREVGLQVTYSLR